MSIRIADELEGDPPKPYVERDIGSTWVSDVHALVIMAGDREDFVEWALLHPTECSEGCEVSFTIEEGGLYQPSGYWQIPETPGVYLIRLERIKGGWVHGSTPVEHDAYLIPAELDLEQ